LRVTAPDAHSVLWRVRERSFQLDRPVVIGIVNVTPDSFSDGGNFFSAGAAVTQGQQLIADGADVLDIGGESTRPGATPVTVEEEIRRVVPVVWALRGAFPRVPISVDTVKAEVARAVLEAGASIINDVSGLRLDPAMAGVCAREKAGVVLMHSRGTVAEMATFVHAQYRDVTAEVAAELRQCVDVALAAGIEAEAIVVDPGIGFAKRAEHSLQLLADLPRIAALGYPVLVGVSRKRFIGEITGVTTASERDAGTIGANVAALARGAALFRVHDVRGARQALDVAWAVVRRVSPTGD
jgi:dihydropteroate synthase